ncbi:hypothetical protein [Actinomadura formosensis]|uniref:hypothetical protein n=1 Tax=Actinomadura formosensis TaxID=60706 RepID=UPI003D90EE6B
MTTEIPAPQAPESLRAAMAEWGRHHGGITAIDAELTRLDGVMADLQRQLADATTRHAELGRHRHEAEREAAFARSMVEHGCQLAGIAMPEQPPAPSSFPAAPALPPAALVNRIGEPGPLPTGPEDAEAQAKAEAFHKLQSLGRATGRAASETLTDPAALDAGPQDAGGDQPDPGFQPGDPDSDSDSRRRRGGRRNG